MRANSGGLLDGLVAVGQVYDAVKYRRDHWSKVEFNQAVDLNLHYEEPSPGNSTGGFWARIDGKNMRLSGNAVRTAARMMKVRDPRFFKQFADPDTFPKMFRNAIDNPGRRSAGVVIRHDGVQVRAILPRTYRFMDMADFLEVFVPSLEKSCGVIKGIQAIDEDNGDYCSYRIVVGSNIMPSVSEGDGQFVMLLLRSSETGAIGTESSLGLFRTVCTNSAIRRQTLASWDHKNDPGNFLKKSDETIRHSGYYRSSLGKLFEALRQQRLGHPAVDVLNAFHEGRLITRDHFEASRIHAIASPVETQYDLFNVATRAAQDLPTLMAREKAEGAAMDLFTSAGGIMEQLRKAAADRGSN